MKIILKKIAKALFTVIVSAYVLILIGMKLFEDKLVYFPNMNTPDPVAAGLPPLEVRTITSADGIDLLVWHYQGDKAKPTILYFHGNAGNLGTQAKLVKPLMQAGYNVYMIEFRGFGGNAGAPTEMGLYSDARSALNDLKSLGIAEQNIILYGRSLGTGVASKMAEEIDAKGLILQAPFTSAPAVAKHRYPYLPDIMRDKFDSLSRIKSITEPLFIFHGDADRTVPPYLTVELFEAANEPKQLVVFPGGGHSNIFLIGGNDAVLKWLSELQ